MKKKILLLCYGLALTAFTTYIALDTFVLSAAYQTDATQINTSMFADAENSSSEKEGYADYLWAEYFRGFRSFCGTLKAVQA